MNLSLLRREQSCQPCAPTQTVYENLNLAKTANPDRPQNWHACAICMSPLAGPKDGNADLGSAVAILEATCKHAFHQACLHEWALNNLDVPEKSADGEEFIRLCDAGLSRVPCPVCRVELDEMEVAVLSDEFALRLALMLLDSSPYHDCTIDEEIVTKQVLRLLAVPGVDINARGFTREGGEDSATLLTQASMNGFIEMVNHLLSAGAEVDRPRLGGQTALALAVTFSNNLDQEDEIVRILLNADADLTWRGLHDDSTLLMRALLGGNPEILQILLDTKRVPLDATDHHGDTVLMLASEPHRDCEGLDPDVDIVTLLLDAGADVTLKDKDGCTALMRAQRSLQAVTEAKQVEALETIITLLERRESKMVVEGEASEGEAETEAETESESESG